MTPIDLLAWIGQRLEKPPGWERLVRRFAGPECFRGKPELCLVRDGQFVVVQPWVHIGWQLAMFGTYEPELRVVIKRLLQLGGVAIDVGANIGWHSVLMGKQVGSGGRVLAVEANPSVRQKLAENIAVNGLTQTVIIPCALADQPGQVCFFGPSSQHEDSGNGHIIDPKQCSADPACFLTVETRTLDAVVAAEGLERLDLLKIDVEGYEWPVLQGAIQTITRFRPHVIFEYLSQYAERGQAKKKQFAAFFENHRYRLFALRRNWAEDVTLENWPESADIWAYPLPASPPAN